MLYLIGVSLVLEYQKQNSFFFFFWKVENTAICTSLLFWISNVTAKKAIKILKIAEIVICKRSGLIDEVKIMFSDNSS